MQDEKLPTSGSQEPTSAPRAVSSTHDSAREKRISELRKLYQSGEYKVAPLDLAASIIDEHLQ